MLPILDLILDEALGDIKTPAVLADVAFHEDRQQGLNHVMGALRFGIGVGDGEKVVPGGQDRRSFPKPFEEKIHCSGRGGRQVVVRRSRHLLQVGPGEQYLLHQAHLCRHVVLHRNAAHQRLQHIGGVDVDARRGLVAVGDQDDRGPADDGNHRRDQARRPAPLPDGADIVDSRCVKIIHRSVRCFLQRDRTSDRAWGPGGGRFSIEVKG